MLGVPIFDTTLVTVTRLTHGLSPLQGGATTPATGWSSSASRAGRGRSDLRRRRRARLAGLLLLSRARPRLRRCCGGFVLTWWFLLGLLVAVPVYENSRQRRAMPRVVREHEAESEPPPDIGNGHDAARRVEASS